MVRLGLVLPKTPWLTMIHSDSEDKREAVADRSISSGKVVRVLCFGAVRVRRIIQAGDDASVIHAFGLVLVGRGAGAGSGLGMVQAVDDRLLIHTLGLAVVRVDRDCGRALAEPRHNRGRAFRAEGRSRRRSHDGHDKAGQAKQAHDGVTDGPESYSQLQVCLAGLSEGYGGEPGDLLHALFLDVV